MAVRLGANKFIYNEDPVASQDINDTFDAVRSPFSSIVSGNASGSQTDAILYTITPTNKSKYVSGVLILSATVAGGDTATITWKLRANYEDSTTEIFTIRSETKDNSASTSASYFMTAIALNITLTKYATSVDFLIDITTTSASTNGGIKASSQSDTGGAWTTDLTVYSGHAYMSLVVLS